MMNAISNVTVNNLSNVKEVTNMTEMNLGNGESVETMSSVETATTLNNGTTVFKLDASKLYIQLDIDKVSDPDYLKKDVIAGILNMNFCTTYTKTSLKKVKREVLVEELREKLAEFLNDEEPDDTEETVSVETPGSADGFCEPEQVNAFPGFEEMVDKYTSQPEVYNLIFGVDRGGRHINGLAYYVRKYGKGVYVSQHILTSVIAEQITGKPLKDKNGNTSTYTQYEIDVIKEVRSFLVNNITRFTTTKDGAITGYFLNAYTTYKINSDKGMKYWFRYSQETINKTGKKGVAYIVRNNKLYMGNKCLIQCMQYTDYVKLDNTCSFWEFV